MHRSRSCRACWWSGRRSSAWRRGRSCCSSSPTWCSSARKCGPELHPRGPRTSERGGLAAAPSCWCRSGLDVEHRDDAVVAVDDNDLVADHKVHVSAPLRMNVHDDRRDRDDADARRHHRAHADREVDVGRARYVAAGENGLPDLGALLRRQRGAAAAGLLLLRLVGRVLTLRSRAGLALLALLALRGLALGLARALVTLGRARALALLTLPLAGGLLAVALAVLRLRLVLLTVSALRALLLLRRLTRGLVFLAALLRALLRLALLALWRLPVLRRGAALRPMLRPLALRGGALRTTRLAPAAGHVLC